MAHAAFQPTLGHAESYVAELGGRLCVAAGGAVTAATSWFKGGTWTKGSNGEYTLQLEAKYRGPTATGGLLTYGLTKAAAGQEGVEVASKDFAAGTFVFRFTDADTAAGNPGTDPAAAVELDVVIKILNSSLPKG